MPAYPDNSYYSYPSQQQNGYTNNYAGTGNGTYNQGQMNMQNIQDPQNRQFNNQQFKPTYILGRMIKSEEDVVANEVPMDGNYATFIQEDLDTIFLKKWGRNGLIDTKTYKLIPENGSAIVQNASPDIYNEIMSRLDNIEKCLKRRPQNKKPYNKNNQNKEE